MNTTFKHLNPDWNADPNVPLPEVFINNNKLILEFFANPYAYKGFNEKDKIQLIFIGCRHYRIGSTNDEGWYMGQCRFSGVAPKWGEFYEITGDLKLDECPNDWNDIGFGQGTKHFLFYLRDETFECNADDYYLEIM